MSKSRMHTLCAGVFIGAVFTFTLGATAARTDLPSDSSQAKTLVPKAGPDRPAAVPDGYVITPFGYFHASCVQSLAKGDRILADGRMQRADGATAQSAAVCTYAHYTRSGERIEPVSALSRKQPGSPSAGASPEINGWLEVEGITTGSPTVSYGGMTARWTVPPAPSAQDGQVLFFFPGLEDINDTQSILQPVLQWNSGQWSIASWNCCLNGIVTNSPGVNVSPGNRIYGSITSTCPAGTLTCATWNVLSLDLTTGESTTLGATPSDGQTFNWAFGGVLEPYYVISCEDFPPDGSFVFDQITVFNQNLKPIHNPQWGGTFNSTDTPQCGFGASADPRKVTLDY